MKFFRNAVLGAMLFGAFAVSADDIYDNMIDTEAALKQWSNAAAMTFLPNGGPESDESAVRITATDAAKPVMAFFKVDIDKVRGKTVKLSAKVKGENISKPDKPYLGIKMMMIVTMADGKIDYPDTTRLTGDFGWRELKTVTTVPPDAKSVTIQIGLQGSTGTIYFSDLELDEED